MVGMAGMAMVNEELKDEARTEGGKWVGASFYSNNRGGDWAEGYVEERLLCCGFVVLWTGGLELGWLQRVR